MSSIAPENSVLDNLITIRPCLFKAMRGKQAAAHEALPGSNYCGAHEKTMAAREAKAVVSELEAYRKRREEFARIQREAIQRLEEAAELDRVSSERNAAIEARYKAAVRAASRPNSARSRDDEYDNQDENVPLHSSGYSLVPSRPGSVVSSRASSVVSSPASSRRQSISRPVGASPFDDISDEDLLRRIRAMRF